MASIKKRPNGKYRARYRDEDGHETSRHFAKKGEAQEWLDEVTSDLRAGRYVDPSEGRVTFEDYAESWRTMQVHRESTASQVRTNFTRHVYPVLGQKPIATIKTSHIQSMVKALSTVLAPATVEVIYRYVANVFSTAVADRVIKTSPCISVKLPKAEKPKVIPLGTDVIERLLNEVPDRYRALLLLGAGTGLRSGEARGITVDRLNFFKGTVTVDRQLIQKSGGGTTFGPPKTDASYRTVPLPWVVLQALLAHQAKYQPSEDGLFFTTDKGLPIARNRFSDIWRPAAEAAGIGENTGFHDLRHYYASLLIHHGESVKVVQDRLGHKTAIETLDTYGHLWPNSDESTREAVDAVLGQKDVDEGSDVMIAGAISAGTYGEVAD